ncbi:MAG: hypothetical protein JSR98_19855 [Proteobacteria bacterium]|nr:hypothetical protein [Pseudomonadota bacterium]
MAPLSQYLIADRDSEVALARSAAPPSVSGEATVLVLGAKGYETAVTGKNGFVCVVERSWTGPFDDTGFWNPKVRAPICYNRAAAKTVLTYTFKRTGWALAGWSKPKMEAAMKDLAAKKQLATPAPGAMSYMLSRGQYLNDDGKAWRPHMMFHVPMADAAAWGANLAGSPIMLDTDHKPGPEPESVFMMAATAWSDGTPAPGTDHHH